MFHNKSPVIKLNYIIELGVSAKWNAEGGLI